MLLKSARLVIKLEKKDLNAMSAVTFGENHPHQEVTNQPGILSITVGDTSSKTSLFTHALPTV